jgi:hypothetical protein
MNHAESQVVYPTERRRISRRKGIRRQRLELAMTFSVIETAPAFSLGKLAARAWLQSSSFVSWW